MSSRTELVIAAFGRLGGVCSQKKLSCSGYSSRYRNTEADSIQVLFFFESRVSEVAAPATKYMMKCES